MLSLDEMLRLAGEQARKILIEMGHPNLMPCYVLAGAKGDMLVVGCAWSNDDEKAAALIEVRRVARDHGAVALSFVSEVWMVDSREMPDALMMRPSENPKRREYVFAVATDGERTAAARQQIIRDKPGGKIIALVKEEFGVEDCFGGRIIDILPRRENRP